MQKIPTICISFLLVTLFFGIVTNAYPQDGTGEKRADTITTIIISGNKKTRNSVVQQLAGIALGDTVDTTLSIKVKQQLQQTNLFSKVDVLLHATPQGYRVYLLVTEKFYFLPYDFGGELYSYRYGRKKGWWRARVGMQYSNFRGKAEILRTSFSFWDWRSLGMGWYKPLLPTPYFFSVGASADMLPDQIFKINHTILRSSASFGRKLPENSRIDLSLIPMYRRRIQLDSLLAPTDTVRVYEAFTALNFRTDHRNRFFDPTSGWMLSVNASTNALYTRIAPVYGQLSTETRLYVPGIAKSHRIAFRGTATLRNAEAGSTHRILIGGEGSVRGYANSQFGLTFYANNSLTAAVEYRFPLYEMRNVPLFPLDQINPAFASVTYRLDGALILDYGRVSADYTQLFSVNGDQVEEGIGSGFSLRLVIPELEHSICFDLAWGTNPWAHKGYLTFMPRPAWHFYLDTYF